ncbi:MAG: MBL fold metallo-hydrolase [Syntrophales bacterium]|jgi:7,8-dihydropterin-6-yl-methyl-4-(beta-D-ribofuranosyl)aminobenzene 5'-phosphate synthase
MNKISILKEVEKVEILTLQDNFIEITASDNSAIISRARYLMHGEIKTSIRAEHGFSAIVRTTTAGRTGTLLFDFGFSEDGAAANAKAMGVNMGEIEVMVLSHGHNDHFGGFNKLVKMIAKDGIELVLHPAAFKQERYLKFGCDFKARFPEVTRKKIEKTGVRLRETKEPLLLLNGDVLYLGEICRQTEFEKGMPHAFFMDKGRETWDPIEEDTGIAINLKGRGLVVLTGCAHSGIVNTVNHARTVTGISAVHTIMGGFHLAGPAFEPIVGKTIEELKKINPAYIVPTHCTGRKSVIEIEKAMPAQFILNMAGTGLIFSS